MLATSESPIPSRRFVEAVGISERILRPQEKSKTVADGVQQDRSVAKARQVRLPSEVVDQLLQLHMISAPQRHAVEFHSQTGRCETGDEEFVATQLLARPYRESVLAGQSHRLPFDRSFSEL